jgi:nitroimidazol reductase NimA-like FMN-containing flavoprotein (pyridoxamine 5'-phosphate oxidase superfamily)
MPAERAVSGAGAAPRCEATWREVSATIEAHETYLVTTVGPSGEPHVTPVLGLWIDERLYFNSADAARKARNLARNPHVAVSVVTDDADFIVRGSAAPILDVARLDQIARSFPKKYEWWHPQVRDGRFVDAEDDAPRTVFEVRPRFVVAFGRRRGLTASRWDFESPDR